MNDRPTGIIRTLPSLEEGSVGHRRMTEAFAKIEKNGDGEIYIALSQMPKIEVLHIYLLISGEIKCRLNIAGYVDGDKRQCWDSSFRKPKYWAICTAPLSRPQEPIKRR